MMVQKLLMGSETREITDYAESFYCIEDGLGSIV